VGKAILLIISGGIAAYKCPDLVRRLKDKGHDVRCVLTRDASRFVTPLSLASVSQHKVYQDLFSEEAGAEMDHIQLSRISDLILVAPATANTMAKMAYGLTDNLASAILLGSSAPIMIAPAMNPEMWHHAATQNNLEILEQRGVLRIGPCEGDTACGEVGLGRMAEPQDLCDAVDAFFKEDAKKNAGRLTGRRALVTSGPTFEAIDPVRYIANRSSGKQGHAIAQALAQLGAETVLVTGPTALDDPDNVTIVRVETARQMLEACTQALPVDIAVCAAAVADWRCAETAGEKIKKINGQQTPTLALVENPDILETLSEAGPKRPKIVVGFAAETNEVIENAQTKKARKKCDWIVANDISAETGILGGNENTVTLISAEGVEDWPKLPKQAVAERLAQRIAQSLETTK
jgi:phosphopantothenoylcysteine decarboxylase / phosphopantothenate---cysteine ligase